MLVKKRFLAVAAATAALSMVSSGLAAADTVTAFGDAAHATVDLTVSASCSGTATSSAVSSSGSLVVTSTGSSSTAHFQNNKTLTLASTPASPITVTGLPATISNGTNWSTVAQSVSAPFTVTAPAGTTAGDYVVGFSVTGPVTGSTSQTLNATFAVHVTCTDTTPPVLSLPANITTEATGATTAVSWTATATDAVDGSRPVSCTPVSGSSFAVATTTVSCSASDTSGNTSNGSFTVTVTDTTPPVVTPPGDKTAEATSSSGAAVTYSGQSATDLVDGTLTPTCAPASGSTFPLGTTAVSCSATDAHGNTGTASFNISVGDTTAPVVSVPADITREATGPSGAVATFSSTAHDAVDGDLTPTCAPASGSTFVIGSTSVSCSATDTHSNTGTGAFSVTVQDTTPPELSDVPSTQTLEATGNSGAALSSFGPTASDLVSGSLPVVCKTGGSTTVDASFVYPLNVSTTVTCTATDSHGNTGSASYTVTVEDTTGPALTVPANMTVEATSGAGAAATFAATATDLVDGTVTPVCDAASGDTFSLGVNTVTCTATDAHHNHSDTLSFTITVVDTTPPVIAPHGDETAEAASGLGAAVTYTSPATSDLVDGSGTATCAPASGAQFALGDTTVSCDATDAAGNPAVQTSFVVHVVDTTPPTIAPHSDVTGEATSASGALVSYTAPVTSDLVDGSGTATCAPASGAQFALGDTTVSCDATDAAGNPAVQTSFVVHVVDTTAPVIAAHSDVTAEATGAGGAVVTYTAPSTSDAVDGAGSATCAPLSGSTFVLGDTVVSCDATDAHGNLATGTTFTVHVVDTTAPVIAAHSDVTAEATGAGGAVVTYTAPSTSDAVDGAGSATCAPLSGSTFVLGDTVVSCDATDAHGNLATGTTFTVHVVDTTAPIIASHPDVTAEATSASGASVSYTSPATSDAVDGTGVATCVAASGSLFALGDSTVTCNAADTHHNAATPTTFGVHVVDTTPPVIASHSDVTAEAASPSGATVTYISPATSDAVDGVGAASCLPASGSLFALGSTTVTCAATDANSNVATPTTFSVTVQDTIAPVIAAHADVTATATSASGAVVSYTSPSWTDAVSGTGTASCAPASGTEFAVGITTINCQAVDGAGNGSTSQFHVIVTFGWHGFFQPIDAAPNNSNGKDSSVIAGTVFNKAKAGSSIPVKFDLSGNMGLSILAAGYPRTTPVSCTSATVTDTVEETTTSASGLKYDGTTNLPYGQYIYTWKTPSSLANTCQRLEVRLADGTSHYAFFQFTK